MWPDPTHNPRMQILDQERKHGEEKGAYPGPQLTMMVGVGLLIVLAIVILLLLLHLIPGV